MRDGRLQQKTQLEMPSMGLREIRHSKARKAVAPRQKSPRGLLSDVLIGVMLAVLSGSGKDGVGVANATIRTSLESWLVILKV